MNDPRREGAGLKQVGAVFGLDAREWWPAAASAVLFFAAYPPFHLVVPSLVALVPLAVAVRKARTPRRAARIGFVFGLLHYGLLLHWMVPALARLTATAPLVYATAVMLLALCQALACWLLGLLRRGDRVPLWCALPLVWTAVEWGIAHAPGTLAYPWLGLGTSLTGYPELVGIAELAGARGVTFWLALVNGLVAEAVVAGRRARPLRAGIAAGSAWLAASLLVAAVPAAWGAWRARHLDLRPGPVVTTVRTTLRAQPHEAVSDREALAAVDALLPAPAPGAPAPSLVVLPEGTFRGGPDQPEVIAGLADLSRRLGAPVVFGMVRAEEAGRYNSAARAGPAGLLGEPYDKRRLVPWVERMPLADVFPGEGGENALRAGAQWTVFEAGGLRAGTLICYEAAFAAAARALRRAGARVLLNITNDAWFARSGAFAVAQHEAHLVMRAIETRTGVARSANLGPAGFVDPTGRVRARVDGPGAGATTTRMDAMDAPTWYVRVGDVAGPGAAAALLLLLLFARPPPPAALTGTRAAGGPARNRPLNALRAKSILRAPGPGRPRVAQRPGRASTHSRRDDPGIAAHGARNDDSGQTPGAPRPGAQAPEGGGGTPPRTGLGAGRAGGGSQPRPPARPEPAARRIGPRRAHLPRDRERTGAAGGGPRPSRTIRTTRRSGNSRAWRSRSSKPGSRNWRDEPGNWSSPAIPWTTAPRSSRCGPGPAAMKPGCSPPR